MAENWLIVVDRTEARIYDAKNMRRLGTLKNPLGREKNRAFTTSRPGLDRNRSLTKSSTHKLTGEKSPHDDAAKKFAREVSAYLYKNFSKQKFANLTVASEPRMQGWIKGHMKRRLADHTEWNPKDLIKLNDHELKILFLGGNAR